VNIDHDLDYQSVELVVVVHNPESSTDDEPINCQAVRRRKVLRVLPSGSWVPRNQG